MLTAHQAMSARHLTTSWNPVLRFHVDIGYRSQRKYSSTSDKQEVKSMTSMAKNLIGSLAMITILVSWRVIQRDSY